MKPDRAFIILCAVVVLGSASATAFAYSVVDSAGTTASSSSNFDFGAGFNQLMAPFKNFFTSIEQGNKTTIDIHGSLPPPPDLTVHEGDVSSVLRWADNETYQLAGFRPSEVLMAIYQGGVWVYDWFLMRF